MESETLLLLRGQNRVSTYLGVGAEGAGSGFPVLTWCQALCSACVIGTHEAQAPQADFPDAKPGSERGNDLPKVTQLYGAVPGLEPRSIRNLKLYTDPLAI